MDESSRQLARARSLHERCLVQVCDGDLPWVDRERAEDNRQKAWVIVRELEQA